MKNVGVIEGIIVYPAELKDGKNGSKWCRFKLRNESTYNDKPIFSEFNITCFGTNAEIASMSCKVGSLVEVDYHLQQNEKFTNLIADEIRFKDGQ